MSEIATLISSIGFPIVACLGMGYYIKYIEDRHREEINKLSETVQNNTEVLIGLQSMITTLLSKEVEK